MPPGPLRPRQRALVAGVRGSLPAAFWRLWGASAIANLSDGIVVVVLPLAAIRLGASAADLAGLAVAASLPILALGLVAGGLADRHDRRRTMLVVQGLRIAVTGSLAALALAGELSIPALYVAALVLGAGEAFFDTNAQSLLPMVVARDRLVSANGRLYAAETIANSFVGPPLGGLMIAASVPLALGGAAAGYATAVVGLLLMRGSFRPAVPGGRRSLGREIGEGVAYLARHRLLVTLTGMVALGRLGSAPWFILMALFAVAPGPMGLSEPQYGLLLVTFGLGSVAGTLIAGRLVAAAGRPAVLLGSTLVFGLAIAVPAFTAAWPLIALASVVAGVAVMAWNVTNVSLRQAILPSHLIGRVHATHRIAAHAAGLLGAALAGALGETLGLQAAFAAGSVIVLLGLAGGVVVTRSRIAAAEAGAAAADAAARAAEAGAPAPR